MHTLIPLLVITIVPPFLLVQYGDEIEIFIFSIWNSAGIADHNIEQVGIKINF
jgi:hypothetical protein